MRRLFTAIVLLLLASSAAALPPASGWWWNQNEPGRGFTIEVQDGFMFFIGYLYLPDGSATWYVSQGPYDDDQDRFVGQLLTFSGGPCITCPYTPAQAGPGAGQLVLDFDSPTDGTLTWAGGTIPITRFFFNEARDATAANGLWLFSGLSTSSIIDFTQWVAFDETLVTEELGLVAVGENLTGRTAIAAIDNNELQVVVDASTSFFDFYRYPLRLVDAQDAQGLYFLWRKDSVPSGSGNLAIGKQLLSSELPTAAPTAADAVVDKRQAVAALVQALHDWRRQPATAKASADDLRALEEQRARE